MVGGCVSRLSIHHLGASKDISEYVGEQPIHRAVRACELMRWARMNHGHKLLLPPGGQIPGCRPGTNGASRIGHTARPQRMAHCNPSQPTNAWGSPAWTAVLGCGPARR